LILLRENGGTPCVFWGDVFGIHGPRPRLPACGGKLLRVVAARKKYAYGAQRDYFDKADCVGWTRAGHKSKADGAGLAVIMTNSWSSRTKTMYVGRNHVGEKWKDILGFEDREVPIDGRGYGTFPVRHRSVGVWTNEKAPGFAQLSTYTFPQIGEGDAMIQSILS
jgi:alpha-amylase